MTSHLLLLFMFIGFYSSSSTNSFPFLHLNILPNASLDPSNRATTRVRDPLASIIEEKNEPVQPDFLSCNHTRILGGRSCCPPLQASKQIIDFKFPPRVSPLRVRPPAHMVTNDYLSKLKRAIDLMKALPDEDPRSFNNQANVHCAYCNGFYTQVGYPNLDLKVHFSWLFYPFHRYYLYFVERIMAELIQDPDFAIPFWNWDSASGMSIPPIYTDTESTLYDSLRDPRHQPPVFADFDYEGYYNTTGTSPSTMTNEKQLEINLAVMYRNMVSGAKTASLFMGNQYVGGQEGEPGGGLIEYAPHSAVHDWVGNHAGEDMGFFYSAARDPLFYSHHANVDRMWSVWKSLPGGRKDLTDPAWLDSSFLFYNEKKELVRVKVRDCLDTEKLGYKYKDVATPWLKKSFKTRKSAMKIRKFGSNTDGKMVKDMVFPILLDKVIKVIVPKPKKKKRKECDDNEDEENVLVIEGIEMNKEVFVKFDVLINYEDDNDEHRCTADQPEFAGSFISLAHKHEHGLEKMKINSQRFGISEMLEDLGDEDDDYVEVKLVPRSTNNGKVTIGGIKIILES